MRVTSKGQVTIPIELREKAGLLPHTEVTFELDGNAVRIVRSTEPQLSRGWQIVEHLRRSATRKELTTDQILALTRGED